MGLIIAIFHLTIEQIQHTVLTFAHHQYQSPAIILPTFLTLLFPASSLQAKKVRGRGMKETQSRQKLDKLKSDSLRNNSYPLSLWIGYEAPPNESGGKDRPIPEDL